MVYREVTMLEVKEVLRLWLGRVPNKRIAAQLGLNVKTVWRYVAAARAIGVLREAGPEALDDGLIAAVVRRVQPHLGRPRGDHPKVSLMNQGTRSMRLAEAMVEVNAAELVLRRDVEGLARRSAGSERLSRALRARYLLDGAFVVASCTRAVDRLLTASGAGTLADASPLQQAFRDLHAMSAHAALQHDTATELFGHIDLGLPSGSLLTLI